jgi:hypothetical protein
LGSPSWGQPAKFFRFWTPWLSVSTRHSAANKVFFYRTKVKPWNQRKTWGCHRVVACALVLFDVVGKPICQRPTVWGYVPPICGSGDVLSLVSPHYPTLGRKTKPGSSAQKLDAYTSASWRVAEYGVAG